MGTKNNPSKFDCYANAAPDEPMFILLARDRHAPLVVAFWAKLREMESEDPAVIAEARNCVMDMVEHRIEVLKIPYPDHLGKLYNIGVIVQKLYVRFAEYLTEGN